MMKPEPSEAGGIIGMPSPRRSMNSSKKSSNGEPGGKCGISGKSSAAIAFWVDEMLTTEGRSFSARSAKLPGGVLLPPNGMAAAGSGAKVKIKAAKTKTKL